MTQKGLVLPPAAEGIQRINLMTEGGRPSAFPRAATDAEIRPGIMERDGESFKGTGKRGEGT